MAVPSASVKVEMPQSQSDSQAESSVPESGVEGSKPESGVAGPVAAATGRSRWRVIVWTLK